MNNLHDNIAVLRKEKGLTQEELGNLVGVSMQAVSKWENPAIIPFLMFALELIHRPDCFCYQSNNRCITLHEK
ncbi:MAG: helix-turn-helix transcriptional regulator [Oscillospiraceae bacterium]|nr:helix-turn-helix transcriptional regulator [Oscillospiraceae bacterium]